VLRTAMGDRVHGADSATAAQYDGLVNPPGIRAMEHEVLRTAIIDTRDRDYGPIV
jgi:hypothetical protein